MFQDHTPLQAAGQLLLAFAFLATAIRNAGWKFRQHLDRMLAYRVPQARLVLTAGLALQFTGATLLALDLWRPLGASLLIAFPSRGSYTLHEVDLFPGDPGKAAGCVGGRGGSMHLMDVPKGVMASIPIVSSSIPVAVGSALADKRMRNGKVTVAFFGDASVEEGVLLMTPC